MPNLRFSRIGIGIVFAVIFTVSTTMWAQYTESVLYTFGSGTDGSAPLAGLISDPQGNLYGTTSQEGVFGAGTVFRLAPQTGGGWAETVLFDFSNGTDGGIPSSSLTIDGQGNLYGAIIYLTRPPVLGHNSVHGNNHDARTDQSSRGNRLLLES